jgi:myo-inositol 2-dehydrogenase/D-chiro-inositol 1-dehydrogenase
MTDQNQNDTNSNAPSRREFLKTTAVAGAATAALFATGNYAYAQGSDQIKIGLIGCGGRGSGAALQALNADPGVVLVSVADVFQNHIDNSLAAIKDEAKDKAVASRVQVKAERQFVGLDAYKRLLDTDVTVALIASPPGFHPQHIRGAVEAGKHIFAEKPMGTDAVNVRAALEAARAAKAKNLNFVSGFCWRKNYPRRAFYKAIHEGIIGPVRFVHATYITGPVKPMPPANTRPAGMSDVEWQIRNWYNFVWLSGDGLVEQACHSVDKILWAKQDVPPLKCVANGGRVLPNNEGNIYDHIDIFYEWADGTRATMAQRQIPTSYNDNSDYITGSKGIGIINGFGMPEIHGDTPWKYEGPNKDMYQVEHDELFAAIRKGTPINEGESMARSTLMGIMGRVAAYTGEEITWEQMLKSQENLFPEKLEWNGNLAIAPMAIPGKYAFA